jgi:AcrR family transcriptional regulator
LTPAKRIRRTPDEARRVILDAAEAVMRRCGPGGLRLQEVAEMAGVSHPAILHHFESRDGLVRALNRRTVDELGEALRLHMEAPASGSGGAVQAAFAAYRAGFAERIIWMLQSPDAQPGADAGLALFDDMVERLHAIRLSFASLDRPPDRADSAAIIHLVTIAAFGDAVLGRRLRRAPDAEAEAEARGRFETWLSALIGRHVEAG